MRRRPSRPDPPPPDTLLRIEWNIGLGDSFSIDGPSGEPDSFVVHYKGAVFAEEDDDVDEEIGRIEARRCLLGEESPFYVLDAEQELSDYVILFANDRMFREDVAEGVGDLLVLDRLGLAPEYRRADLGLVIIRETIRQIGSGCGAVAMMPAPLNYDHTARRFEPVEDAAGRARLLKYYRRLGFRSKGKLLFFDLSLKWPPLRRR